MAEESGVIDSTRAARVKFSIVIPTYNRIGLLQRAVESALAQEGFPNYEVVVVDDCSPDSTWDWLRSIENPQLRVFRNDSRMGMGPNWNKAVCLSHGQYVFILQDDDVALPNLVKHISAALAKYKKTDLICLATCLIDSDETDRKVLWQAEREEVWPAPQALLYFVQNWTLSSTQIVFSRALFDRYGGFDLTPPIMSDAEAILRWMLYAQTLVIPEILTLRRVWSGSVTSATQASVEMLETMRYLLDKISQLAARSGHFKPLQLYELRESLTRAFVEYFERLVESKAS